MVAGFGKIMITVIQTFNMAKTGNSHLFAVIIDQLPPGNAVSVEHIQPLSVMISIATPPHFSVVTRFWMYPSSAPDKFLIELDRKSKPLPLLWRNVHSDYPNGSVDRSLAIFSIRVKWKTWPA